MLPRAIISSIYLIAEYANPVTRVSCVARLVRHSGCKRSVFRTQDCRVVN